MSTIHLPQGLSRETATLSDTLYNGLAPETSNLESYQISPDLDLLKTEVHFYLKRFVSDPDFTDKMNVIFGSNWDRLAMKKLTQDWQDGDFTILPEIDVLTGTQMNGANAAFSAETDTIYISDDFLIHNGAKPTAMISVLLEEVGHAIDFRINKIDAVGDEGDLFQRIVQGVKISDKDLLTLKSENDHSTIFVGGKTLEVEMSRVAVEVFNGRLYQSMRGAGNVVYTRSSINGRNWTAWVGNGATLAAPELEVFNGRLYQSVRGTDNVVYTRSTANGTNWTNWVGNGQSWDAPELEVFNGRLYQSVQGIDNVVYTRSTANGRNWTNWIGNGQTWDAPELEVFNGRLYQSVRGTNSDGLGNVVYTRSTANGTNWTNWVGNGLTFNTPELEAFGGRLYQSIRGTDNVVYTRSTANGTNWTNWVGNGATWDAPELEVFNGRLYQSVQGTNLDGLGNVVYTRSSSNGTTWSNWVGNGFTRTTPTMTVFRDRLYQTIEGTDQPNGKIYSRYSTNPTATTWSPWREYGGATAPDFIPGLI